MLAQGCGVGEERGAGARIHTLCRASSGHPKCRERATCVHDPGHCERLAGRRGSSSVPSCGASSRGVRGSPAGCITEGKKSFCSVTTRRRNFWLWNGLGRGLGLLAAHSFCLGMLGFDLGVLGDVWPAAAPPASGGPLAGIPDPGSNRWFQHRGWYLRPHSLFRQGRARGRRALALGRSLSFNVVGAHGRF